MRLPGPTAHLVAGLLACVAFLGLPAAGHADARLTVSPLIVNLSLAPGASTVTSVSITASGSDPLDVEFQHADFGFSHDSYTVTVIEDSAPRTVDFSTRGWFTTPRRHYHVRAGHTVTVPVTVTAPTNATPGMHLGAAFFRTAASASSSGGTQVVTAARSGPLLFITVRGGHEPRPALQRLDVPGLVRHGPIRPKVIVASRGSSQLEVSATLELRGGGRTWRASLPSKYVIPKLARHLRTEGGADPVLGDRSLAPGRYRLHVRLEAQPGNLQIDETRTIWVIPTWIWVVGIVAVLVLIGALTALVMQIRATLLLRRLYAEYGEDDDEDDFGHGFDDDDEDLLDDRG